MAKNSNFKYEIKEHIVKISENDDGYSKQLNLISYNGYAPKYDIRQWNPDGTMGKGITLNEEEASVLAAAIADRYIKSHPEMFDHKEWVPAINNVPVVSDTEAKPEKKQADIVPFRTRKNDPQPLQKPATTKQPNKKAEKPKTEQLKKTKQISGFNIPADVELPF